MPNREVLIIDSDADEYARLLTAQREIEIPFALARTTEQALSAYSGHCILLGDPNLIAEALPEMKTIEWVQSSWAGVTPLLVLDRRDYLLTGIKNVFGQQMGEYVLGCLLAHELMLVKRTEQQKGRNWFDAPSGTLRRKTMGIMGTGSIGQRIALMSRAFDLRIFGYSRRGESVEGFDRVFAAGELKPFLQELDYLISVLPDTRATDRLLDTAAFERLPDHCYFVNVGRGNVVDEGSLIAALQRGQLAGAALDVFDQEPLARDNPLWTAPNLRITGHIAAPSQPEEIAPIFVENFCRFVRGESLEYVIDFERGY